tara:strand:- start:62 stop:436 length:375 start_codon:yes stop_codon:yes gene_type:complete
MFRYAAIVALQIASLLFATSVVPVQAANMGTSEFLTGYQEQSQRSRIDNLLASEQVQQELQALGVDHADAMARVAALTPTELQQLNQRLDSLPAGSSLLGLVGAVFVILLILELVGVTNIFTKV